MKKLALIITAAAICMVSGCAKPVSKSKNVLKVDFPSEAPLRYKMTSEREVELNFDPGGKLSKGKDAGQKQKITETLEMVVAYKGVKSAGKGVTTVQATFEKVAVKRSSMTGRSDGGRDAVNGMHGKSITFDVGPAGNIENAKEFNSLLDETMKQAFGGKGGGIKDPEMTSDVIALVWFMWNPISSVPNPSSGVKMGDMWTSQVLAPTPMPMNLARDVQYTFKGFDTNEPGTAIIDANYSKSKMAAPRTWPFPYSGAFQMRGVFGFLRGYSVLGLAGTGEYLYSVKPGRLEKMEQSYKAEIKAEMPFALGSEGTTPKPNMIMNQKLSAQLLKD